VVSTLLATGDHDRPSILPFDCQVQSCLHLTPTSTRPHGHVSPRTQYSRRCCREAHHVECGDAEESDWEEVHAINCIHYSVPDLKVRVPPRTPTTPSPVLSCKNYMACS
jgi:hypothetical protein